MNFVEIGILNGCVGIGIQICYKTKVITSDSRHINIDIKVNVQVYRIIVLIDERVAE